MNLIDETISDKIERLTIDKSDHEKFLLWMQIKNKFVAGDRLYGTIYYKAHYGVWLDIELEFPALLRIPDMINLDYQKYIDNECYVLGEKLALSYIGMNEKPDKIIVAEGVKI